MKEMFLRLYKTRVIVLFRLWRFIAQEHDDDPERAHVIGRVIIRDATHRLTPPLGTYIYVTLPVPRRGGGG